MPPLPCFPALAMLSSANWFMLLTHNSISKSPNPQRRRPLSLSLCFSWRLNNKYTLTRSQGLLGDRVTIPQRLRFLLGEAAFKSDTVFLQQCRRAVNCSPLCKRRKSNSPVTREEMFTESSTQTQSDDFVLCSLAHSLTSPPPASANQHLGLWHCFQAEGCMKY